MSTLYEYYITDDDGQRGFYNTLGWAAQTFTPSSNHIITSVKMKLIRMTADAAPGTITAHITATDGAGKPTGSVLASGTYVNGNSITTTSPGEWIEISLGTGYLLLAGAKYTLYLRCETDDPTKPIAWRRDGSSPTYAGGSVAYTTDSGATWDLFAEDFMFEEWGGPQGSSGGGAIYPINTLLRASGIRRTFWSGLGGQAVYQMELALGGLTTSYVSPMGSREIPSAAPPSTPPVVTPPPDIYSTMGRVPGAPTPKPIREVEPVIPPPPPSTPTVSTPPSGIYSTMGMNPTGSNQCPYCGAAFATQTELIAHLRQAHGGL